MPEKRRFSREKRRRDGDRLAEQAPQRFEDALLELCRSGVLTLGIQDGEPTYQVTDAFGELLTTCHEMIMATGGYEVDPIGQVAALALTFKFERILAKDLYRLTRALESVLQSSIVASDTRYRGA